ncbi:DUF423 domain-containing protein [Cellvibrio japonicus]|uniref:Putative membrane protein n=1 Tax=Cellvibrio japonicus (strain Ueda107) TaxID=498211 RepID=B3PG42_CELJU|nr:DUF423 domain-containing protein [Cellvibrio japonicus]ACE84750.1 putative membrane protein [Cellvibrio japonicus Ueda107]QEI13721.1 DUF423 domain-containing protein [Cellvibrio japonicus]QEI17295.1 DUF423 domain-containing protein [Cellvibrio japonicus]QEI20872.1 DUF423 domain-containing protein [Cellvibrio japonicus]
MARVFLVIGALSGLLSVVLGAFAAHGLKQQLSDSALQAFQIGVQYQMYHALALILAALLLMLQPAWTGLKASGLAFILGALLFSGSLYALALGGPRWLGPVTPLGGLSFMLGWLLFAVAVWRGKHQAG